MTEALRELTFSCVYPNIKPACAERGIYTITELFRRVERRAAPAIAAGHVPKGWRGISLVNLRTMLGHESGGDNFISPYDTKSEGYHLLAVFVGAVLNKPLTHLFGTPEALKSAVQRPLRFETPQRRFVGAVLANTPMPIVDKTCAGGGGLGRYKVGITREDLRRLSTVPYITYGHSTNVILDGASTVVPLFYQEAAREAQATNVANDISAITGCTVEELFFQTVTDMEIHDTYLAPPRRMARDKDGEYPAHEPARNYFPLHDYWPLEAAAHVADTSPSSSPDHRLTKRESVAQYQTLISTIREICQTTLTPRERLVLTLHLQDERSMEKIGDDSRLRLTKQRISQIEKKALAKLRRGLERNGWRSLGL